MLWKRLSVPVRLIFPKSVWLCRHTISELIPILLIWKKTVRLCGRPKVLRPLLRWQAATHNVMKMIPFMILPVYTAVEQMDWHMTDAGRDLGASPAKTFFTITLPMTLPGLMTGCVLVFVPSLALFFMSDLLGGPDDILIGNVVQDQLLKSRDWPFAAALSVILLVVTWIILMLHRKAGGKSSDMTLF